MNILLIVLSIFVGIVLLVLLIAMISRKEYDIRREIIIDAPQQKVYDYLRHLKNQDNFNKWVMADPGMKREFHGIDGTAGFVYAWDGKKGGAGEQEIKNLVQDEKIETEVRFIRPFKAIAYADYIIRPLSATQTAVVWTNRNRMQYPLNSMITVIEKMLARDMDSSLATLKRILEKH